MSEESGGSAMRRQMVNLGVTLLVVGLVAALGLGLTYTVTREKIEEQDRLAGAKAAADAMPGIKDPAELKMDAERLKRAKKAVPDVQGVLTSDRGTVITLETKAYGGPMSLAIGIDLEGEVTGIAVVSNKETMGLGSKALEAGYFKNFVGKTAKDRLEIKKDVQGITGATVTSKAVALQVKQALEAWQASR